MSFDVAPGQIVGLIGPNGAGKTSLFNCISRLYQPTTGSISYAGQDVLALKPHDVIRHGIARTFQNVALFGAMSVLDNVLVGAHTGIRSNGLAAALRLRGARDAERAAVERALTALDVVGLRAAASERAARLPFPDQKRVELARALVSQPRLLLLDEPASGLTHAEVQELSALISSIHAAFGLTVLLVEHRMDLVMTLCDRLVVLSFGRTIASGPPAQVRADAAVIEAYLGAAGAAA